jgi:ATP-dependent RNA helicase DDX27
MGFAEVVEELLKLCSKKRQTMLFSATMNKQVGELANLTLNNPVHIKIDSLHQVAPNLTQEFARVRPQREDDREAMLLCMTLSLFH